MKRKSRKLTVMAILTTVAAVLRSKNMNLINNTSMRKTAILLAVMLPMCSVAISAQSRGAGLWADISLSAGNLLLAGPLGDNSLTMQQTDYAADAVLGWRFGSRLAVGAGATASCVIKSGAYSFPLFLRLRYDILDRTVSPYLNLDLGWSLATRKELVMGEGVVANVPLYMQNEQLNVKYSHPEMYYRKGLIAALTAGVSIRIERGNRIYFGVTAGACQLSRGVDIIDKYTDNDDVVGYATVPIHKEFWKRIRPEIRFKIGFEL